MSLAVGLVEQSMFACFASTAVFTTGWIGCRMPERSRLEVAVNAGGVAGTFYPCQRHRWDVLCMAATWELTLFSCWGGYSWRGTDGRVKGEWSIFIIFDCSTREAARLLAQRFLAADAGRAEQARLLVVAVCGTLVLAAVLLFCRTENNDPVIPEFSDWNFEKMLAGIINFRVCVTLLPHSGTVACSGVALLPVEATGITRVHSVLIIREPAPE